MPGYVLHFTVVAADAAPERRGGGGVTTPGDYTLRVPMRYIITDILMACTGPRLQVEVGREETPRDAASRRQHLLHVFQRATGAATDSGGQTTTSDVRRGW